MTSQVATKADYNLASPGLNTTKQFADFLARFRFEDLPERAVHEARRGLIDWLGCALAGSGHSTIDKLLVVLSAISGKPQASVLGRKRKLGLMEAALANGQMGHMLDYDDTHMGGVVLHTSGPVLAALLPLIELGGVGGRDLICAYAAGFEAGVRVGQSAPGHHAGGWHLTGTLGSIAAGAAAARLLRLDAPRMVHTLGIAATQASGMQQNRGTMCKSFHAGKAAANGVLAALLAERGFDSTQEIIEGEKGFCRIYSDVAEPERLTEDLGNGWVIESNGHKPYACGVVLHPLIDAVIAIRNRQPIDPAKVGEIGLRVHPLVLSITGVREPATGLQSKFSTLHAAAVALIDGAAGVAQFADAKATDPAIVALRRKVKPIADPSLRRDEACASIVVGDQRHEAHIAHATGTAENPMSDEQIESKFLANAAPVIGADRAKRAVEWVAALERQTDMRELIALVA
ncbi:MAG: MmgE/PrpD family protein [Xanthobacteraceae bacterium]